MPVLFRARSIELRSRISLLHRPLLASIDTIYRYTVAYQIVWVSPGKTLHIQEDTSRVPRQRYISSHKPGVKKERLDDESTDESDVDHVLDQDVHHSYTVHHHMVVCSFYDDRRSCLHQPIRANRDRSQRRLRILEWNIY